MFNFATKSASRNATGVDTLDFAKNSDLARLKSGIDKLVIHKLADVPRRLTNLKDYVDILDADKLVPVPDDLSKLSNTVKNDVVKKINDIKTTDTSDLVDKADYGTKIDKIEKKIYIYICIYIYIAAQIFNDLTSDNFATRLKQLNLAGKK